MNKQQIIQKDNKDTITKTLTDLSEQLKNLGYQISAIAEKLESTSFSTSELDNSTSFCLDASKSIKKSIKQITKGANNE